jgi:hypothetical protein
MKQIITSINISSSCRLNHSSEIRWLLLFSIKKGVPLSSSSSSLIVVDVMSSCSHHCQPSTQFSSRSSSVSINSTRLVDVVSRQRQYCNCRRRCRRSSLMLCLSSCVHTTTFGVSSRSVCPPSTILATRSSSIRISSTSTTTSTSTSIRFLG